MILAEAGEWYDFAMAQESNEASSTGKDATEAFEDVGHSDEARALLPGMLVGEFEKGGVRNRIFSSIPTLVEHSHRSSRSRPQLRPAAPRIRQR